MMDDFVSIIVPVRNMERTIGKTFEYLMDIDYPRAKMEIICTMIPGSRSRQALNPT